MHREHREYEKHSEYYKKNSVVLCAFSVISVVKDVKDSKRLHSNQTLTRYAILALILIFSGCALLSKDISGEFDESVLMRSENITYSRPYNHVPVVIRVKNPDMVYRYQTRITGSGYLKGATVRVWKIGETMKNASPFIWGKYLDVRSGKNKNLPVIEMDLAHISGQGSHDMSGVGVFSSNSLISNDLTLTLVCRFYNEAGRLVNEFSSTRKFSETTNSANDRSVYVNPGTLLENAFNDILSEFFRDKAVEVVFKGFDIFRPDIDRRLPGRGR